MLFRLGGLSFHSYTVMLYLGLLAGLVVANLVAHRIGIDAGRVFISQLVLIPFALLGARLFHVLFHWRTYRLDPRRILKGEDGGADMFGGMPAALLLSWPLLAVLELPFWRFWDVTAFTIFTGMFVTRFGCLLNGCCGGRCTEGRFGLNLANVDGEVCRRIPMQLLEAGWTLMVLGVAWSVGPRLETPGALFFLSIALYCVGRILLDPGREERYPWIDRWTVHQGIYGGVLILCVIGWVTLGGAT